MRKNSGVRPGPEFQTLFLSQTTTRLSANGTRYDVSVTSCAFVANIHPTDANLHELISIDRELLGHTRVLPRHATSSLQEAWRKQSHWMTRRLVAS